MAAVLRGSLSAFPLDLVMGFEGRPTAARHAGTSGEEALGSLISLDPVPFEFVQGETGPSELALKNDVVLKDPSVSRQHARIFARSGRFVLADSGSTAGTKIDGQAVKAERVPRGGEIITLGEVALKLEMVER